jgi:hypothetical protein
MPTLDDLKESIEKVLEKKVLENPGLQLKLELEHIRDGGTTFPISTRNVINYPSGGSFNCGFSRRSNRNDVYQLFLGLRLNWQGAYTIDTAAMQRIITRRNNMRESPEYQRQGFVVNSCADTVNPDDLYNNTWLQLERWLLGFTLTQFLEGEIEISDAEKKMERALGYFLAWETAVFSPGLSGGDDMNIKSKTELLEKCKNLIFTGAPGTGKTYLAKQIASKMILSKINNTVEPLSSEAKNKKIDEQYRFVQFHPSYDYTDFVEGLRPKSKEGGELGFELKNGIFKQFCRNALKDENNPYIFVIDEINRGEISKIFGELFFSIDPGYRGNDGRVQTQYANIQSESDETIFDKELGEGWFYVPENVYIIGTMNDIDRSVESFDFAMRRRFVWKEITAAESAVNMNLSPGARKRMTALNNAICPVTEDGKIDSDKPGIEGLSPAYHIGAAYFLVKNKEGKTMRTNDIADEPKEGGFPASYEELWEYRLKPLLFEYVRGTPDADKNMDTLKNAFDTAGNG